MKHLVGKKLPKKIKFMGEEVTIKKLSISEVLEIQKEYKEAEGSQDIGILKTIIRLAVEGASELSDEDIDSFPLDELANLSNEIIKYSGMDKGTAVGN